MKLQTQTSYGLLLIPIGLLLFVYIRSFTTWSTKDHVVLLFVIAFLIYKFLVGAYNSTSHCYKDRDAVLKKDAVITDVTHKAVGSVGEYRIRTTVFFSDSFRYVSHLCYDTYSMNNNEPYVTDELKESIIHDAIEAHNAAVPTVDVDNKK